MKNNILPSDNWWLLFAVWVIALISTLSALFIGEVMGQTPCVLCWYQRIFMFPLAVILGLAAWKNDKGVWLYALPLCLLGGLTALFHTLLYFGVIPEPIKPCDSHGPSCSGADMVILGFLPLPTLSFVSFTLIAALLLKIRRR